MRHGWRLSGHPRLASKRKMWMPGTRPGMTGNDARTTGFGENRHGDILTHESGRQRNPSACGFLAGRGPGRTGRSGARNRGAPHRRLYLDRRGAAAIADPGTRIRFGSRCRGVLEAPRDCMSGSHRARALGDLDDIHLPCFKRYGTKSCICFI